MVRLLKSVNNISILWKVSVSYFFLILIIILYVYFHQYNASIRVIEESQTRLLQTQLQNVVYDLDKKQIELYSKIDALSMNINLRKYLEYYDTEPAFYYSELYSSLGSYLKEFKARDPLVYSIRIFKNDSTPPGFGNIVYDKEPVEKFDWYKEAQKQKIFERTISGPYKYYEPQDNLQWENSSTDVVSVHALIPDINLSHSLGVAEVNVSANKFFEIIFTLDTGNTQVVVQDRAGQILLNTGSAKFSTTGLPDSPGGRELRTDKITLAGESYLVAHGQSTDLGLSIALLYPYSLITPNVQERIQNLLFTLLLVLISMFVLTYIISKLIFWRLRKLAISMKTVEKGDFSLQVEPDYLDEIGRIKLAFNKMVMKIDNLVNSVYKAQLVEKEATLSSLMAQMDPHFLMNSLEAIRMIARLKGDRQVSEALYSLSNIYRNRIHGLKFTTIGEELSVVGHYVYIQNLRHDGKIGFLYDVDNEWKNREIPSLVLQPLVENCIVHGYSRKNPKFSIVITGRIATDGQEFLLSVKDNGKGISEARLQEIQSTLKHGQPLAGERISDNGIALFNISERIKFYYGDSRITIHSKPGEGTEVILRLPVGLNGNLILRS